MSTPLGSSKTANRGFIFCEFHSIREFHCAVKAGLLMKLDELLEKYDLHPYCFCDCGDGWLPLVERLIFDLIAMGWTRDLAQVKEKFGGLRFYANDTDDKMDERIHQAELEAEKTCEQCGSPGEIKGNGRDGSGWLVCLCEKCREKENLRHE